MKPIFISLSAVALAKAGLPAVSKPKTGLPAAAKPNAGLPAILFSQALALKKAGTVAGLFFLLLLNLTAQNRFYVNATATGLNNGQSWVDAFQDLQSALQTAQVGNEIWVAQGVYRPTGTNNRNISFEPLSGVQLYGGFVGTENELSQRDWSAYPTVLSGDIGVSGDSTDNTYSVMYLLEPDTNTIVDGFVFQDGVADEEFANPFFRSRSGGGMYIMGENGDAYPEIRNCVFLHNTAANYGGGVMVYGGNNGSVAPRFVNCRFEANFALGGYGGGLARIGGSWIERGTDLSDCVFYQNVSGYRGGGFYYRDNERKDTLEIQDCVFEKNRAIDDGGGAFMTIGRQNPSGFSFAGSSFIGNIADDGTAFTTQPQGLGYCSFMEIDSCVFEGNIHSFNNSTLTASISIELIGTIGSKSKISHSKFAHNNNVSYLFGIEFNDSDFIFSENLINECSEISSLLSLSSLKSTCIRNSVFSQNINFYALLGNSANFKLDLEGCLFVKNTSMLGNYILYGSLDTIFIKNSTFSDNNIGQSSTQDPNMYAVVLNSILKNVNNEYRFLSTDNYGEYAYCSFDAINCPLLEPYMHCGPGNIIGQDPLFRDTANLDFSLLPCSPLLNAGSNAAATGIFTDLEGNPRVSEGVVDIGAYETPAFAFAAAPQVQPACIGASNGRISVSPVFGCEPYHYNWSPQAGNGPELNGLPPGNYLLTITDGSGRQILDTVHVTSAPAPELNALATDLHCGMVLGGSINAGASGGTAPYHYQWQPNASDTALLSHLSPGAYAFTVVDANGCQDSASASISLLGMLTLMVDGEAIPCYGETGWLSATPLTGAAPFQWHWQGWPGTDSLAQPLSPGIYAVTVSDTYGCTAAFAFPPLTQPDSLWASVGTSPQTDLSMPNGAAVVTTISGGTLPHSLEWNTGSTNQAITGIMAGTYTVTVTDKNGCEAVIEVEVQLMVGTNEAGDQAVLMYPNPAADWLRVVLPARQGLTGKPEGEENCFLELSDVSGRVLQSAVLSVGLSNEALDLRGLPSGTYMVRIREGNKALFLGKVVKP